jgi:hypothetical protein
MGACKYDLVSTDCYGKKLPSGLVPFSVKQRQEMRPGKIGVAFIQYVEINVFDHQYRLLKKEGGRFHITIDGQDRPSSWNDETNGIKIYNVGKNLLFSTGFGLTVHWNGEHKADVSLCDAYANSVCGLCGNADGNSTLVNEFVDRTGLPVLLEGSKKVKFFKWGSEWKTADEDNSRIDLDGSL